MHHLAIMRKSWGLIPKILSRKKTIESRWYQNKYSPWDKIKKGDRVYFKNSGEPVTVTARVSQVLQFTDLTPRIVKTILKKYATQDGIESADINKFYQRFKNKKYCLLIFLKNQKKVKPFQVDKRGFGLMSAWITINDIKEIKRKMILA